MKTLNTIQSVQLAAASRRAFRFLASKVHPQLPLTPRESEQLLQLLTTSFRRRLDQEHPIHTPKQIKNTKTLPNSLPTSSQDLAARHIDSILTDPLLAVKPARRESDALKLRDAALVLSNPLRWFVNEIASGTADLEKASICLDILDKSPESIRNRTDSRGYSLGFIIANHLSHSGLLFSLDKSFIRRLCLRLRREKRAYILQNWFFNTHLIRAHEVVEASTIKTFRKRLFQGLIGEKGVYPPIDKIASLFIKAMEHQPEDTSHRLEKQDFAHAAMLLSRRIHEQNESKIRLADLVLYDPLLQAIESVVEGHQQLYPALLRLHHPSAPDASAGLQFLRTTDATNIPAKHLTYLTELSLGVASRLLLETKYADAQWVLNYATTNFPHLTAQEPTKENQQIPQSVSKTEWELENLKLLDTLSIA